jgi:hypothetical protein
VHDELGTPGRQRADISALEGLAAVRQLLLFNSQATRGSSSRRPPVASNVLALVHKVNAPAGSLERARARPQGVSAAMRIKVLQPALDRSTFLGVAPTFWSFFPPVDQLNRSGASFYLLINFLAS